MNTTTRLFLALCIGLATACAATETGSDPAAGPEQDLTAAKKASLGNWDCAATDEGTAIEDIAIRTALTGSAKADLEVSGPGDFLETYHYKATGALQPNGDVVLTGASFHLTISAGENGKKKEHDGSMTATGPKSAEIFPGQKIESKVACVEQEPEKVAKEGELCGANSATTIACAAGLTCKSNCPAGAKCIVGLSICQK
jgi:hypothetical protein